MRFTAARAGLAAGLATIARIVERRTTIPILAHLKLEAGEGGLMLTGTDLDMVATVTVPASIEEDGVATAPAAMLHDIVRKAEGEISFARDEGRLIVKSGRSRVQLLALDAADFPDLAAGELPVAFTMRGSMLADALGRTSFAISTEETRYYLNGVFIHCATDEDGPVLRLVSTDGHRLSRVGLSLPRGAEGMPGIIVPRKAVPEIVRLAEAAGEELLDIALSNGKLRVAFGGTVLLTKTVDGTFPDYERVIPKENDKRAVLAREEVVAAVERVLTVSSEKGRAMRCTFADGALTLQVHSPDHGEATDEVPIDWTGAPFTIGFNGRYLVEVLAALGADKVEIAMSEPGAPAVLTQADGDSPHLCVLMPMRV